MAGCIEDRPVAGNQLTTGIFGMIARLAVRLVVRLMARVFDCLLDETMALIGGQTQHKQGQIASIDYLNFAFRASGSQDSTAA